LGSILSSEVLSEPEGVSGDVKGAVHNSLNIEDTVTQAGSGGVVWKIEDTIRNSTTSRQTNIDVGECHDSSVRQKGTENLVRCSRRILGVPQGKDRSGSLVGVLEVGNSVEGYSCWRHVVVGVCWSEEKARLIGKDRSNFTTANSSVVLEFSLLSRRTLLVESVNFSEIYRGSDNNEASLGPGIVKSGSGSSSSHIGVGNCNGGVEVNSGDVAWNTSGNTKNVVDVFQRNGLLTTIDNLETLILVDLGCIVEGCLQVTSWVGSRQAKDTNVYANNGVNTRV
jgi:hypothetical protein